MYIIAKKIKRELSIGEKVELSPHTLRRSFTTYHAENGLPLPLLQKLLGHSSIRTTALYWRNIYSEDDKGDADTSNILAGKIWLESKEKEPPKPTVENFPEQPPMNLEPIIRDKPVIPTKKLVQQDNSPLLTEIKEKPITNYQSKSVISEIPFQTSENSKRKEISEQLPAKKNQKENILLAKIRKLEAENSNSISQAKQSILKQNHH